MYIQTNRFLLAFHVKCQTNFLKLERTFFLGQLYKLQKREKGYQRQDRFLRVQKYLLAILLFRIHFTHQNIDELRTSFSLKHFSNPQRNKFLFLYSSIFNKINQKLENISAIENIIFYDIEYVLFCYRNDMYTFLTKPIYLLSWHLISFLGSLDWCA